MKTREEFSVAIVEMIKEATQSGFTLVIGFDGNDKATLAGTGNVLTTLGLADELRNRMRKRVIEVQ